MQRGPLIAGNWKMNCGGSSGVALAGQLVAACGDLAAVDIIIAPPATALAAVAQEVQGSRIQVAAQNMHHEDKGAFTGEISPEMLVECGCQWVIIGHSERRHLFGETNETVAKKTQAALATKLRPIICVGETLEEREAKRTLEVVFTQLDAVIQLMNQHAGQATLAYEPVWAIGTGKVAGPDQAQEVHAALRERLAGVSTLLADSTRILYGGSVKPDNAAGLMGKKDVDGALVGGASLKAASFVKIIEAAPSRV